jgi:hypothetical protein
MAVDATVNIPQAPNKLKLEEPRILMSKILYAVRRLGPWKIISILPSLITSVKTVLASRGNLLFSIARYEFLLRSQMKIQAFWDNMITEKCR